MYLYLQLFISPGIFVDNIFVMSHNWVLTSRVGIKYQYIEWVLIPIYIWKTHVSTAKFLSYFKCKALTANVIIVTGFSYFNLTSNCMYILCLKHLKIIRTNKWLLTYYKEELKLFQILFMDNKSKLIGGRHVFSLFYNLFTKIYMQLSTVYFFLSCTSSYQKLITFIWMFKVVPVIHIYGRFVNIWCVYFSWSHKYGVFQGEIIYILKKSTWSKM